MKKVLSLLICALIVTSSIVCTGIVGSAEGVAFPAFPNSTDFDSASTVEEVLSSISTGGNWRSRYAMASGIFGESADDKCVNFIFSDGNSYNDLNDVAYITDPASNVSISGKIIKLSFSLAAEAKNFDVAGLMVGTGLGMWVSNRASINATDSASYGMVGMTRDGIYAFGEKLMDYETGTWYDFDVVLYGGTTKFDVYVDDVLVKEGGEVTSAFDNIARSALRGYSKAPAKEVGMINIYFDDVATSEVVPPKFPDFPFATDFDSLSDPIGAFADISTGGNWRSRYAMASGVFGADADDKCMNFIFSDGNSYNDLNDVAYITDPSSDFIITDKIIKISYSLASEAKNFDVAGLMVGTGLGLYVSNRASVNATDSTSYGMIGMTRDGIYAFGEKLMDYETGTWYDFDVVIYGGTTKFDVYVNDVLVKEGGEVTSKFNNIARSALRGYSKAPAADVGMINIYFDNVVTDGGINEVTDLLLMLDGDMVEELTLSETPVTYNAAVLVSPFVNIKRNLIVASYEGSKLTGIDFSPVATLCPGGEDTELTGEITLESVNASTSVKCFLWGTGINPVEVSREYKPAQ